MQGFLLKKAGLVCTSVDMSSTNFEQIHSWSMGVGLDMFEGIGWAAAHLSALQCIFQHLVRQVFGQTVLLRLWLRRQVSIVSPELRLLLLHLLLLFHQDVLLHVDLLLQALHLDLAAVLLLQCACHLCCLRHLSVQDALLSHHHRLRVCNPGLPFSSRSSAACCRCCICRCISWFCSCCSCSLRSFSSPIRFTSPLSCRKALAGSPLVGMQCGVP